MPAILIIEDEPEIRELLRTNLEIRGFDVSEAADGAEAVDLLLDSKPDLIVLDVMMPEVDGFEVLEFVRARTESQQVPVVLLTALAEEADRIRGLALGAQDYVTKPFAVDELMLRIASLVQFRDREARLVKLTITDPTTDLYNSRYLRIRLPQLILESHGEMSMAWVRVGGLDRTIDERGWSLVALVEARTAQVIRGYLDAHEEGFALGGGHFAITTWKTGQEAERWHQGLEAALKQQIRPLELGVSVSTTFTLGSPKIGEDADDFVDRISSGGRSSAHKLSKAAMAPQEGRQKSMAQIIAERHKRRRLGGDKPAGD